MYIPAVQIMEIGILDSSLLCSRFKLYLQTCSVFFYGVIPSSDLAYIAESRTNTSTWQRCSIHLLMYLSSIVSCPPVFSPIDKIDYVDFSSDQPTTAVAYVLDYCWTAHLLCCIFICLSLLYIRVLKMTLWSIRVHASNPPGLLLWS